MDSRVDLEHTGALSEGPVGDAWVRPAESLFGGQRRCRIARLGLDPVAVVVVEGSERDQVKLDEELNPQINRNKNIEQKQVQNGEENEHQQLFFEVKQRKAQVVQRLRTVQNFF